MAKITKAQRAAIKDYAETVGERYRITRDGEVHIYGRMPNSVVTGWWLSAQSVVEMLDRITRRSKRSPAE